MVAMKRKYKWYFSSKENKIRYIYIYIYIKEEENRIEKKNNNNNVMWGNLCPTPPKKKGVGDGGTW
jgi:hypothetical protein